MYKLLPILLFAYGLALTTDDIYDNSYALIIGIDKYENVRSLDYAVKDAENIEFDLNFRLYELLEDKSYLETAYNQIQETADNLEPDVAAKFLSYPIPKAIVEEWEKVK